MPTSYSIHETSYPFWMWDEYIRKHEVIAKDWAATMGVPWKDVHRQYSMPHERDIMPYMAIRWVYYF